ncbi:PaaI family thioesterase [Oceanobacter mangrovi]|uniref:PaaI family thioesterase n=1 Tax=Oceanobacter mangrovi TaxID=2862510 RepID=UPI001C8D96F0|nr:PaaI family thioesterase [Oceanobacter mangrovi]
MENSAAFQDFYPDAFSHCYGCGRSNPHGHHLKSRWDSQQPEQTLALHTVDPKFSGGVPGHVYGGMVASLLDCHGTASAAAFQYRQLERQWGDDGEPIRFVTGSLTVNFHQPTPIGVELAVRARLLKLDGRKCQLALTLGIGSGDNEQVFASGEMLAIQFKAS